MSHPLIINLAPTGMIPTKKMTPHVPVHPDEVVHDVLSCVPLGVSMVHLHARDEQGEPTYKRSLYERMITPIRESHPDTVIVVTTSGRTFSEFDQRADPLQLTGDAKPDMGSLTLSSLNFNKVASVNSPDMIMRLAETMQTKGIKPELEVFDLGMVNFAHYLIKKGLLEPPYYFNILLGNIAAAQAKLLHLGLIVSELPQPCFWSVAGVGDAQLDMNCIGAISGSGIRIGLEDTIWFDGKRTILATNRMLVERMRKIIDTLGRPVASGYDVRDMLNLPVSSSAQS
jgi:uncharacterized protein (DUF849 family)